MATRSPQASGFADGSHNVKSSFVPAERDQRDPAARRSRRHPCPVASGSVGRAQGALLSATPASGDLSKDKSTVPARFSEDSDLRLQDLGTDQANSGRGNDFRSESRGHPSSNDGAPQQARSGSAVSSRSTNRRDSFVSASAF